jgi:molybdenum cofactor cytidylyltransferase
MADLPRCALILLAAGASRRMGRPKQLLPVGGGKALLRQVAEQAVAAPVSPVLVVLGSQAPEIAPSLDGLALQIVTHDRWTEGMGSSVRAAMRALEGEASAPAALIIALADQPDCTAKHLTLLIESWRNTGRSIVASIAGGELQPPVLFAAEWFPRLRELAGDTGARQLLREHAAAVATVPLSTAADLDTPADYDEYLRRPQP